MISPFNGNRAQWVCCALWMSLSHWSLVKLALLRSLFFFLFFLLSFSLCVSFSVWEWTASKFCLKSLILSSHLPLSRSDLSLSATLCESFQQRPAALSGVTTAHLLGMKCLGLLGFVSMTNMLSHTMCIRRQYY